MKKILKFSAVIAITIIANVVFFSFLPNASVFAILFFNALLQTALIGLIVKPTPKEI